MGWCLPCYDRESRDAKKTSGYESSADRNDSAKKNSLVIGELLLKILAKFIRSIAYYQDLLIGIAFRKPIENGLDIILRLHPGHQQKIIAGADSIFFQHTLLCVLKQLRPISDIFTCLLYTSPSPRD